MNDRSFQEHFYYLLKHLFKPTDEKDLFNLTPYLIAEVFKKVDLTQDTDREIADSFLSYDEYQTRNIRFKSQTLIEKMVIENWNKSQPFANLQSLKQTYYYVLTPCISEENLSNMKSSLPNLESMQEYLIHHEYLRFLVFTPKEVATNSVISNCLAILDGEAIVLHEKQKVSKLATTKELLKNKTFNITHPFQLTTTSVEVEKLADEATIKKLNLPTLIEGIDTRPIEQIDCIILDISGSMDELIPRSNKDNTSEDKVSKLTVAVDELNFFIDKLCSYGFKHAVGIITFNDTPKTICEITPDIEEK